MLALLAVLSGGSARPLAAQPPQSPITVQGRRSVTIRQNAPVRQPCVSADIAGEKVSSTACAAEKLQGAARAAQQAAALDPTLAVPNAHSPADKIGIATVNSANDIGRTNLRGATSLPPRPTPAVPAAPFPRRP